MEQDRVVQVQPSGLAARDTAQAGCYAYCIASRTEGPGPRDIGIGGSAVYTVGYQGLCALVHECPPQPYRSEDAETVAAWVQAHHRVVESAWKRWGSVLPLAFNTIIRSEGAGSAQEGLRRWLAAEYDVLRAKLESLRGKAEYAVQVLYDVALVSQAIAQNSPEIRKLQAELRSQPRGLAYMQRQRVERLLRKEIEASLVNQHQSLYSGLVRCADGIRVEKTRAGSEGPQMLLNLSCLVSPERYPDLESELGRASDAEGYSVRLVGPLPPYSFC